MLHTLFLTLPRGSLALYPSRIQRLLGLRPVMLSILPHPHTFRCRRPGQAPAYLASHSTASGTVNTDHIRHHGCSLRPAQLNADCRPHPTTVAAAPHYPHTRPPDVPACLAYQRLLVNTCRIFDLCRPHARACPLPSDRHAFALTRSGADVDLPGFGCGSSDMSDPTTTAQPSAVLLAATHAAVLTNLAPGIHPTFRQMMQSLTDAV